MVRNIAPCVLRATHYWSKRESGFGGGAKEQNQARSRQGAVLSVFFWPLFS